MSHANLLRDVEGLYNTYLTKTDDRIKMYDYETKKLDVINQKNKFYSRAYEALKAGDVEAYEYIVADMVDRGAEVVDEEGNRAITPTNIASAMKNRAKKDIEAGENEEEIIQMLADAGIKFRESGGDEEEEETFDVDDLNGDEFVEYSNYVGDNYQSLYNGLKNNGLYNFDEDQQNDILADAYTYVKSKALAKVGGNRYKETNKMVLAMDEANSLGISLSQYLIVRKTYNITDAKNSAGVTVRGLKKTRLREYLNSIPNLTTAEYNYFWREMFDYK